MLKLIAEEDLSSDDVARIDITVPPYTHKLVGHPFEVGDDAKVNAQFSIQYCVANALLRRAPPSLPTSRRKLSVILALRHS